MSFEEGDLSMNGAIQPGQSKMANDGDFDAAAARAAADAAFIRVMDFRANSNLMEHNDNCDVARVDWEDITVEGLLGVGGFACVCKVSVPLLELEDDPAQVDGETGDTKSSRSGTSSSSYGSGRYALKCLNQRTTMTPETFARGAEDLAGEFLMLSNLRHDNIVRLYGVSNGCVSEAFQQNGGYFLGASEGDSFRSDATMERRFEGSRQGLKNSFCPGANTGNRLGDWERNGISASK
jgi:hypothetical protein